MGGAAGDLDAVADPPELNLRVLVCLGRYLDDRKGVDVLERVTAAAGLTPSDLDGKTRWVAAERFERLLAAARRELASDDEFFEACLYRYAESQGLLRYLITLSTPLKAYEKGAEYFRVASRISTLSFEHQGSGRVRFVYRTQRPESRLACLSRMASIAVAPTLWNLPRARVDSRSCVAEGADCCEYVVNLYDATRWLPSLVGGTVGALLAALAFASLQVQEMSLLLLPAVGALAAHLIELRRVNLHNVKTGGRFQELMAEVAVHDAEARRELMQLHQRQGRWLRRIEEHLAERSEAYEGVQDRIAEFRRSTHSRIRGLSHDIRNPLQVLAMEAEILEQHEQGLGAYGGELVAEHRRAVGRIEQLLTSLMDYVTSDRLVPEAAPTRIDVADLTERLRRQLRALALGRPIKISVFRVREAPAAVEVDAMLLDRILDNLLTNAAKYTQEGSIVVEVGGTPGHMTLKVSDTGRGIEPERISQVFQPGATRPSQRAKGSYGVGLSVVVDLVGRIGGRLEVMSEPNVGTTFWLHVPTDPPERTVDEAREPRLAQVLTIRRGHG
ncbi:MAG: ATP-binding protein [Sandaracinaceae bacterium]